MAVGSASAASSGVRASPGRPLEQALQALQHGLAGQVGGPSGRAAARRARPRRRRMVAARSRTAQPRSDDGPAPGSQDDALPSSSRHSWCARGSPTSAWARRKPSTAAGTLPHRSSRRASARASHGSSASSRAGSSSFHSALAWLVRSGSPRWASRASEAQSSAAGVGQEGVPDPPGVLQHAGAAAVPGPQPRGAQLVGQGELEVGLHDLVVAEGPAVVRAGGEQLRALEVVQRRLAAGRVEQRVAQRAGQDAERAAADHERAQVGRHGREHVVREVGAGQPGPGAERVDGLPPLGGGLAAGGQVEQLQPGDPAARAPGQQRRRLRAERLAVDVPEELLDLPGPEPQVVAADLEQALGDREPGQVDPRRSARAEQQPQPRRTPVDEPLERPLGLGVGDLVHVVQDEQHLAGHRLQPLAAARPGGRAARRRPRRRRCAAPSPGG